MLNFYSGQLKRGIFRCALNRSIQIKNRSFLSFRLASPLQILQMGEMEIHTDDTDFADETDGVYGLQTTPAPD